ncbi:hypothetical protein GCM10009737_07900 [Nocardioides lentus]|uniref:TolC family protein n=1 Tax=Nocardioides lentus TaxID=338077 RepID=A0ABP5AB56_9ACTN
MSAGTEALRRARSAVAEARDTRMEAADLAMVALHDDTVGSDAVTEAMEVWRRADADLQAARGRVALARAAAGLAHVVALESPVAS